jgi:hemoglobin-like flavoprotein
MLNQEEIDLVQADWEKVLPIADVAATLFYDRLFTLDPKLRPLFKSDLTEQKLKLMKMIGTAVNGLNQLSDIVPAVQALGQRHVSYGVKAEHYETVGAALLWTLKQGLADNFDGAHEAAWARVYTLLAQTMIGASKRVAVTA